MKLAQTLSLTIAVAAFGYGPAFAQSTQPATGSQSGGTTSGPASPSGQPTTLGSNGHAAATPHQADAIQHNQNRSTASGANGSSTSNGAALGQKPGQKPGQE